MGDFAREIHRFFVFAFLFLASAAPVCKSNVPCLKIFGHRMSNNRMRSKVVYGSRSIASRTVRVLCDAENQDGNGSGHSINLQVLREEEEELQNYLQYIGALLTRNEAQRDSFVSEKDQWDAQSEEDRQDILSKPSIEARIEEIKKILSEHGGESR
mmetsp:Transcript_11772/g.16304  ORF Transcript_11772/g.16304 Transcript_11772/m.16304 type:complete len:156 (-) Transcript_11772:77-544(-)